MASAMLTRSAVNQQAAKAFAGKARSTPATAQRHIVCRAEEKSIAKVDRKNDQLYFASEASLSYLDGSMPGDFGFDPLGLCEGTNTGGFIDRKWLQYSEVIHCRWAMLGAAGCIAPEVLGKMGMIPEGTAIKWFESGVIPPAGNYDGYWTDSFSLFFIEVLAMQFAELKRLQDYRNPGSQGKQYFLGLEAIFKGSGNPAYPGGQFFNLFNFGKTEAEMNTLKLKEIKNGRLAMLAMFGYGAQATLTRDGPFQNLLDHLADPTNHNILTNFAKVYGQQ